ncbi:MAG: formate/nitrite transporter family protein [Muribaculaceae bacterium]|nr:formate/nitrite transporter family protein [Muribaculaceae bacterium]
MQKEIIERTIEIGVTKASHSFSRLIALSILAGVFISLGGVLSLIVGFGIPEIASSNPGLQKLLSGLTFPVGLFLVVLFGAELFTGNNAVLIPGCASGIITKKSMLRNWTVVWIGNFIGGVLFTYFLVYSCGLVSVAPYNEAIIGIAQTKTGLSPWVIFLRGIGANWCVCLAVWLALYGKTIGQKALACWIPVAVFVMLGYEHCIANMFFIPCGILAGADVTLTEMGKNLLFSTIGNIVGGSLLVGAVFHKLYAPRRTTKD